MSIIYDQIVLGNIIHFEYNVTKYRVVSKIKIKCLIKTNVDRTRVHRKYINKRILKLRATFNFRDKMLYPLKATFRERFI